MANLINNGTHSFSGSWALAASGTGHAQFSGTSSSSVTTSYLASANLTGNNQVVDAIYLWLATRSASPTGTMDVQLWNFTDSVQVAVCTVNVSQLGAGEGLEGFSLGGNFTLTTGKTFQIRVRSSSNGQVTLLRDATAANWNRLLRRTTTASAAAADNLFTSGLHTGAGSTTSYTLTNDNNNSNAYNALLVGYNSTFNYTSSANVEIHFANAQSFKGYGGTISGGPSSLTYTHKTVFDCTTAVTSGLEIVSGLFTASGTSRTFSIGRLASNAASGQPVIVLDNAYDLQAGDELIIGGADRTTRQSEVGIISSVAGNTVTLTANLTNAHRADNSGYQDQRAHVALRSRNFKIYSNNASFQTYLNFSPTATITSSFVEVYQIGSSSTGKRGIDVTTTTGSCSLTKWSAHTSAVNSTNFFNVTGAASDNYTFAGCIAYNCTAGTCTGFVNVATTGTNWYITDCLAARCGTSGASTVSIGIALNDVSGTISNNITIDCTSGLRIIEDGTAFTVTGHCAYGNGAYGVSLNCRNSGDVVGIITDCVAWNNGTAGIATETIGVGCVQFTDAKLWGNGRAVHCTTGANNLVFLRAKVDKGDTANGSGDQAAGFSSFGFLNALLIDCEIGQVQPMTFYGNFLPEPGCVLQIVCDNCLVSTSNSMVAFDYQLAEGSYIQFLRLNQTAGAHRLYQRGGYYEQTTSDGWAIVPNSATIPIRVRLSAIELTAATGVVLGADMKKDGSFNGTAKLLARQALQQLQIETKTLTTSFASYTCTVSGGSVEANCDGEFFAEITGTAGSVNVKNLTAT